MRIFFSIVMRVISPALVTIFLFQLVAISNNFLLPLIMLSNQHPFPVTLVLFTWSTSLEHNPELTTLIITGSLISALPLVVAFLAAPAILAAGSHHRDREVAGRWQGRARPGEGGRNQVGPLPA